LHSGKFTWKFKSRFHQIVSHKHSISFTIYFLVTKMLQKLCPSHTHTNLRKIYQFFISNPSKIFQL
jgi:hypothetical protein